MQWYFWIWMGLVLKIPVVWLCWFVYKVASDQPEQTIGDGEGGDGVRFDPGPRKRGPNDGRSPWQRTPRRGDSGHDEHGKKGAPEPAKKHVRLGE